MIINDSERVARPLLPSQCFNVTCRFFTNFQIRKDEKAMSNSHVNSNKTEAQRLRDLESIRTPENSLIIDAAIASGESAEAAALRIVYARIEEQKMVDAMVAEANKIIARRNGNI